MNITNHDMLESSMKQIPADTLIRLVYVSAIKTNELSVFKHIQKHSEDFNKNNDIAGFLCNNEESFLQFLEGSKKNIFSLMQRIFKDSNHKDVDVVYTEKVSDYTFTDWRMHSLNLGGSHWLNFSNHTQMNGISPFKPKHWPHWFVESFIDSVKSIDYSNSNKEYITFDTLGYSDVEKTLVGNNVLFYIFLSVLIAAATTIALLRYNVIS